MHHFCSNDWVTSHGFPELPGISPWCYKCLCEKYLCQEANDDVFMPEAPAAAEAPSAADKEEEDKVPDLSPRDSAASAPRHGWGWASTSSELGRADSMFSMGGDIEAVNAASVDGFWDGPVWEAEGDAWDADF